MARKTTDVSKLKAKHNVEYMKYCASMIGAMAAIQIPLKRISTDAAQKKREMIARVRERMRVLRQMGADLTQPQGSNEREEEEIEVVNLSWLAMEIAEFQEDLHDRYVSWRNKLGGAGVQQGAGLAPHRAPSMLVGSFLQMLALGWLSTWFASASEGKAVFRMGTMGGFTCMTFALNGAPAAQPRTALLGTIMSVLTCIALHQIDWTYFDNTYRIPVAVAISTTLMSLTGVPHPPAAGTAAAFSSDPELNWNELGMLMVAYLCAVVCAAALVNLQNERRYPSYWRLNPFSEVCQALFPSKNSI